MQAIITEFKGATNNKPARIVAKTGNGQNKMTFSLTHAVGTESENHMDAAKLLRDELGWKGEMIQGCIKYGYVHVFVPEK